MPGGHLEENCHQHCYSEYNTADTRLTTQAKCAYCCNSGKLVMEVANHFLTMFETSSTGEFMAGSIHLNKIQQLGKARGPSGETTAVF